MGAMFGAVIGGAHIDGVPGAAAGATTAGFIGMLLSGVFGCVSGWGIGKEVLHGGAAFRVTSAVIVGAVFAALGAVVGALAGALIVGVIGGLLSGIVGIIVGAVVVGGICAGVTYAWTSEVPHAEIFDKSNDSKSEAITATVALLLLVLVLRIVLIPSGIGSAIEGIGDGESQDSSPATVAEDATTVQSG